MLLAPPNALFKRAPIDPLSTYTSDDRLHGWRHRPFNKQEMRWLREHCDFAENPPLSYKTPGRRRRDFRRVHLGRPNNKALGWLKAQNVRPIGYQPAIDWIVGSEDECRGGNLFLRRHGFKRYHRLYRPKRSPFAVHYASGRRARSNTATYADRASKVTGEVCCIHHEYRLRDAEALRVIGIHTIDDVIKFDHYAFWKKYLLAYEIDFAVLGRMWVRHTRRHGAKWIAEINYEDIGRRLFALCHSSVQELVDRLRRLIPRIHKCLVPINVEHLLPQKRRTQRYGYHPKSATRLQSIDPMRHFESESSKPVSKSVNGVRHARKSSTLPKPKPRSSTPVRTAGGAIAPVAQTRIHACPRVRSRAHSDSIDSKPAGFRGHDHQPYLDATSRMKWMILADPAISSHEIKENLAAQGFRASTIRIDLAADDFRDTCRLLRKEGLLPATTLDVFYVG